MIDRTPSAGTRGRRATRTSGRRATILLLVVLAGASFAQAPTVAVPPIPEVTVDEASILDIDNAPPVARVAIATLVALDAYPLDAMAQAQPNERLDTETAAYMLLNVFGREIVDSLPIPPEEAHGYLEFVVGQQVPADELVTAGTMRDYILTFAEVAAEDGGGALRMALDARYPALAAGNIDTPLTRAGGALMIMMALELLAPAPD